jgi:putative membrane protein
LVASVVIALVAGLHVYFLVLEMFLLQTPLGRRTFGSTAEIAQTTTTLAANQGLYNGFLAAALLWGLVAYGVVKRAADPHLSSWRALRSPETYGGVTVSRRIVVMQAVPAVIAAGLLWLS